MILNLLILLMAHTAVAIDIDKVPKPMRRYVEAFEFWTTLYLDKDISQYALTIYFVNDYKQFDTKTVKHNYIGMCYTWDSSPPDITVSKSWWNQAPSNQREVLVFHEMAHCVFGEEHRGTEEHPYELPSGAPASLMNSFVFDQYNRNTKRYYLEELFAWAGRAYRTYYPHGSKTWYCGPEELK
jgi:hypothetical protein